MTANIENFEINWDNSNFYLRFTDLFGQGERIGLNPEDFEKLHEAMKVALRRYKAGN